MSIQQVSEGLAALSDSIKTTFQLISRLSKLSSQPGSAARDDDGDARLEATQDIHDNLKQHEDTLEALKQEAEDLTTTGAGGHRRRDSTKERERLRVAAQLARLEEDLKQYVHYYARPENVAVADAPIAPVASSGELNWQRNAPLRQPN